MEEKGKSLLGIPDEAQEKWEETLRVMWGWSMKAQEILEDIAGEHKAEEVLESGK